MIKEHFPMGALLLTGLPLALGDGALFIMSMAAVIVSLPLVYGGDVDQVVRATLRASTATDPITGPAFAGHPGAYNCSSRARGRGVGRGERGARTTHLRPTSGRQPPCLLSSSAPRPPAKSSCLPKRSAHLRNHRSKRVRPSVITAEQVTTHCSGWSRPSNRKRPTSSRRPQRPTRPAGAAVKNRRQRHRSRWASAPFRSSRCCAPPKEEGRRHLGRLAAASPPAARLRVRGAAS